jgi:hypothetical protein|tara:strand:+ start:1886 stop:2170 length:285 start_codon:yes stop_codon:yes gene_type:complete
MSYEGYEEYICVGGHYSTADCYSPLDRCPICGGRFTYWNSVNQTNGVDEDSPETMSAPTKRTMLGGEWKYVPRFRYKPDSDRWREYTKEDEEWK